tara:strand:- start:4094 stop:4756 length:663 start_codon:yes stop_codon:yes gene_type:complete
MIYPKGSIYDIYSNAEGLTDKEFIIRVYLDEVATLIRNEPKKIQYLFIESGIKAPKQPTRRELVNILIDNVYTSKKLRESLSKLLARENAQSKRRATSTDKVILADYLSENYQNIYGGLEGNVNILDQLGNSASNVAGGAGAGAQAGGGIGAIIGTVLGLTESVFDWKTAKSDAEVQAQRYKLEIFSKISEGKKTNYTPIVVVGSVLLIGTVVLVFALKK